MTTTINASPTNGLVQTADGSGVLKVQSNGVTTNALAWVNFTGTGTVTINASYNVSSITDNGTGDYTINFTTALSDANYAPVFGCVDPQSSGSVFTKVFSAATQLAASCRLYVTSTSAAQDATKLYAVFFGN
jgi:hypothetical protein